jgi:hypothetical protein
MQIFQIRHTIEHVQEKLNVVLSIVPVEVVTYLLVKDLLRPVIVVLGHVLA